eukprot:NODE_15439_length_1050_cov_3.656555.p1 GENE.NODE_15439_length_1050_cov_3.656555~~NODE_15439_length_1050_cov_3.656555.p1  ORF type:complete len:292 (-),score=89.60 NODE_15439_length_1050_cov_3.656555:174-965(-)
MAVLRRIASLWPVLVLALVRLVVHRAADLHTPTSEYGVHWNFFMTVLVVAILATAADLGPRASGVVGALLLLGHQAFLDHFGGADYILNAERVDIFSANREGILSCSGYLGIHWLSVALGSLLARKGGSARRTAGILLFVACLGRVAVAVCAASGLPPSRRMCNLPYAALVIGLVVQVMASLAFIDLVWPRPCPPLASAYGAIQNSMLVSFLAANLLTGAVNLALRPLLVPAWTALLVMCCYTLAWSATFAILHSQGIVLKLH